MVASAPILLWTVVMLFFVQALIGMCLNNLLEDYMNDHDNTYDQRAKVFEYFGTFSRSMITMSELTLGNFVPVLRYLTNNVSELYGHALLVYKVTAGYAMMRVIGAVFLRETYKTADDDEELQSVQRRRNHMNIAKKIDQFVLESDESNDGIIQRSEFQQMLNIPQMKSWLSQQDIDVSDANLVFDLLDTDNSDGGLTPDELIKGVTRLRGNAKSFDLICIMHMIRTLTEEVWQIDKKLSSLCDIGENELHRPLTLGLESAERSRVGLEDATEDLSL